MSEKIHTVGFEKHTFAGRTFWVVFWITPDDTTKVLESYPPKRLQEAKQRYREVQAAVREIDVMESYKRNLPQVFPEDELEPPLRRS